MRKVLLIEDREQRQKDLLKSSDVSLEKYNDILDNMIENRFKTFIENIRNSSFDLTPYDVIIAHQSIFIEDKREVLSIIKNSCKEGKKLVLFSGDKEISSYSNSGYEELGLSSKQLYSKNLELFLQECQKGEVNIRILAFGTHWKANIMLNVLEKINLFIETNSDEDIDYDEFLNKTGFLSIDNIDIELYKMKLDDNWIDNISEIIKLRDSLKTIVEEFANE